jgi:ring-1,2-phenylacetyl-CoA epoxidase subunit PaaE
VTLVYGNRAERDVIFGAAIDALAAEMPERLRVIHVLSEPEREHRGPRGLLDRAALDALELELDGAEIFVCGPAAMMDAVRGALLARGVPAARIHEERFQSPGRERARARARASRGLSRARWAAAPRARAAWSRGTSRGPRRTA